MEEWEDELQEELMKKVNEYIEKGLTHRQIMGVLECMKMELMPLIEFEFEDEDEDCETQEV